MKTKEEILFNRMDEALQVSHEATLKAMQEYADETIVEFLDWYLPGKKSRFECDRVVSLFKVDRIEEKENF